MVSFYCIFEKILWQNYLTGESIFFVKTNDLAIPKNNYGLVKCQGNLSYYGRKMPLFIEGEIEKGVIKVLKVEKKYNEESHLIEYLSNIVDGVGKTTAEKIVSVTGTKFFEVIKTGKAEALLLTIDGISKEKVKTIVDMCNKDFIFQELYQYLVSKGGNYHETLKVFKKWRNKSVTRLKENPYLAVEECGLSFYVAENIALSEGLTHINRVRVAKLVNEAIKSLNTQGHTFSYLTEIIDSIRYIERNSAYNKEEIPSMLILSVISEMENLKIEKDMIFSKELYDAEYNIAKQLERLDAKVRNFGFREELIKIAEDRGNILIMDKQRECFNLLKTNGVKIITGGAGRGKTTILKGILEAYKEMLPDGKIVLCAPTGRASQKMSEATGRQASTIHRLLEYAPYGNNAPNRDRNNPLDADCVVVDECSMIDTILFSHLLNAIKTGALIILVGDENQLKSVGAGMVFHDIIHSGRFETYRLTSVYRQLGGGSTIIENSDKILNGDCNITIDKSFHIKRVKTKEEMRDYIVKGTNTQNIQKTQILSPMKKHEAGTVDVNKHLQKKLINQTVGVSYGDNHFFVNDKVILLYNNYEHGYFNGDMGYITDITEDVIKVKTFLGMIEVPKECYDEISLAYSITIHKSQGSESEIVVIGLPKCNMLKRSLLYTAVTRAKKKVFIVSEEDALEIAIQNDDNTSRHTNLLNILSKQ